MNKCYTPWCLNQSARRDGGWCHSCENLSVCDRWYIIGFVGEHSRPRTDPNWTKMFDLGEADAKGIEVESL